MAKLRRSLKKRQHRPSLAIQTVALGVQSARTGVQFDSTSSQHFEPYDENLLERSRTQWQFGDWESLVRLDRRALQHHPDRAKLALLVAAGHHADSNVVDARQYAQLAIDWGCSKRLVSQILISGVHNTLGRASMAGREDQKAARNFDAAISIVLPQTDTRLVAQTRTVRETAKLGMLPHAVRLIDAELSVMERARVVTSAHLKIFKTELELLSHELSLAQQRSQLSATAFTTESTKVSENEEDWLVELKKKSVSQLGQDLWVLEKTSFKRGGFFVEFGATDGVLLSNSWLLEKEFGWKGVCAEPNPKFFASLKKNRRCMLSEQCISGSTGKQVEFVYADAFGGSQEYANDDMHGERRAAYAATGQVATLTTVSLDDFLKEVGAPRKIDYLSIDTEGSEFEILEAFPFDRWDIHLLTVEHNFTARRADIRALLTRNGYRCTEQQWDDWYERFD